MAEEQTGQTERFEMNAEHLLSRVRQLIHEGNVRRITIKQGETTVAVFPLTAGVVGALLAPVLAAVGALAALLTRCTIEVERTGSAADASDGASADPVKEPAGTARS